MRGKSRFVSTLFVLLGLAACGGGGGGGGGGNQPPGNQPPAITSPATASVPENSTGTIYQATAVDPDGNSLTFSLSGGADRAAFSITPTGALSFIQAPDFEVPADADRDNVYLVQIAVSDGTTSVVLNLAITVTNVGQDGFRVVRLGAGYDQPIDVFEWEVALPTMFVVERTGRIKELSANGATARVRLDLSGEITTDGERGLLGAVRLQGNPGAGLYVFLTNRNGDIEIRRYNALDLFGPVPPSPAGDVILRIPHSTFSNHNGGWIDARGGLLYLGVGDGGGSGDPSGNAQNPNNLLGKIIRIDPGRDDFPADPLRDYGIPTTNPFAGGGGQPEIWVRGLRNPFRANFDFDNGNLWVGDVGQNAREEIDLVRPQDAGANLGWNILEGTLPFTGPSTPGLTPPVAEYMHGSGPREGRTVIGGIVYRGDVEGLRGQYFFADFITGNIWSIPITQVSLGTTLASGSFILRRTDFTPNQGAINSPVALKSDSYRHFFIVDFDGEIFSVDPA